MDRIPPVQRSRNMARIANRDTKPEMEVRRVLFANGFRYCLHRKDLPGRPDIALPRYRIAVFVHGCFWHGHSCSRGRRPSSNTAFWNAKIDKNLARDRQAVAAVEATGWTACVIWQCSLAGGLLELLEVLQRRKTERGSIVSTR